jgi:hypothetical protein
MANVGMLASISGFSLLQLFQPSYYAQNIKSDTEKLSESIMMSSWYELEAEEMKLLLILNEKLRQPLQVHVGGVFFINLETFMEVRS